MPEQYTPEAILHYIETSYRPPYEQYSQLKEAEQFYLQLDKNHQQAVRLWEQKHLFGGGTP